MTRAQRARATIAALQQRQDEILAQRGEKTDNRVTATRYPPKPTEHGHTLTL